MKSQLMMADTSQHWELKGEPILAAHFVQPTHTVSVTFDYFTGGFSVEGALAAQPTEDDWFTIHLTPSHGQLVPASDNGVLKFPIPGSEMGYIGTEAFAFEGNFYWLRARLIRSYLSGTAPPDNQLENYGAIGRVLLLSR